VTAPNPHIIKNDKRRITEVSLPGSGKISFFYLFFSRDPGADAKLMLHAAHRILSVAAFVEDEKPVQMQGIP